MLHAASMLAALIAAVSGLAAAVCSQVAYWQGQRAQPPRYFGGAAMTPDVSAAGVRAEGQRERAALRANLFQGAATSFVVATALIGLAAAVSTQLTMSIAALGVTLGFGQPALAAFRWWPEDRKIVARTEYYVMMQQGLKLLTVDEQRREFTKKHPRLARWL